ncbi:hypothetical protein FJT64_004864 [Amphibalanus amphitrite]|uniref:Uncharacterized protein n=1 Tax=Amphibalanus amphitrite TaxID=1232801 RepID=A0A6A4VVH5_AMPAM|nr:hypothetical protein FJT64_004864 [Amphibalanus amphitrite]
MFLAPDFLLSISAPSVSVPVTVTVCSVGRDDAAPTPSPSYPPHLVTVTARFPEALIRAINDDIEMARELCARPEHAALAKADFFYQTGDGTEGDSDGPGGSSVGRVERSGSDTSIDH